MISTCVHCKKEFEWEKQEPVVGCEFAVQCCHCRGCVGVDSNGICRPLIQSKPLQVAKKWVVKLWQEDGYDRWLWLCKGLYFTFASPEHKFDTKDAALKALADHIIKYKNTSYAKLSVEEVPA